MAFIRYVLVFVACIYTNTRSVAQVYSRYDSLVAAIQNYKKEDTTKLKMLIEIGEQSVARNPDKGLKATNEAIELAQKLNTSLFLGQAYAAKAKNTGSKGNTKEALELMEKALTIFQTSGNQLETANALNTLGKLYYMVSNIPKSMEYSEKALKIAEESAYKKQQATALANIGTNHINLGDKTKALDYIEKALKIYEGLDDKYNIAGSLSRIGIIYTDMDNFQKALEYLQKSVEISKSLSPSNDMTGRTFNTMGSVYGQLGDYLKSLEYFQKALKINEELGNKRGIAFNYGNIATTYRNIGDSGKALDYFQKSLKLNEDIGNKAMEAADLHSIGSLYMDILDYKKSAEFIQKALIINEKLKNKDEIAYNFYTLGKVNTHTLEYEKAIDFYQKSMAISQEVGKKSNTAKCLLGIGMIYRDAPDAVLSKMSIDPKQRFAKATEFQENALKIMQELHVLKNEQSAWYELSKTYEKMGDYSKAYTAYQKHIFFKDSIQGEAVKKQITRKEIQYEFDKKEAVLKFEQQLTVEQLEKQKLISVQQQQALSLKEQALVISNKEKDLQHLAFLKEKAEKQEREQQLSLAEKDKQIQSSQLTTLIQEKAYQVQVLAKKNALIGFLVSSLVAILLGLIAFYFWFRQKQAKRDAATQALFAQQLLKKLEEERGRIAFDLHDSISHELLTLKRGLEKQIPPSVAMVKIDEIIEDIRKITRNLHPVLLDKIGLKLSIDALCEQYGEVSNLFVSHEIEYDKQLPKASELQVFRIIQEVLTNTAKYAHANASYIGLKKVRNALSLEIRDNGKGFDVQKSLNSGKAFGLHSILQRSRVIGGNARIDSSSLGTTIQILIPI